jgi:hypothetical protein
MLKTGYPAGIAPAPEPTAVEWCGTELPAAAAARAAARALAAGPSPPSPICPPESKPALLIPRVLEATLGGCRMPCRPACCCCCCC